MALYERLEELRRGGTLLPSTRGFGSKVLERRLSDALKDRPARYAADFPTMHRLITRGVYNLPIRSRFLPGLSRARSHDEH